jgi:hypothetical protein
MEDFIKCLGVGCAIFGAITLLALLKGGTPDRMGAIFIAILIFGFVISVFVYHTIKKK